jgi:subtilisin family serine protease
VSYYNQQWSILKDVGFYTDHSINNNASINGFNTMLKYTGKSITVAIIDTGFDINHLEIKDRIIAKRNFTGIGTVEDISQNDGESHGTSVAGIIASSNDNLGIRGVAPDVRLVLIKMPKQISYTTIRDMFQFALNNDADIINCSWGTNNISSATRDYLNDISKNARGGKGAIIIFSSGNDNEYMLNDESTVKGVIGVGATNKNNLRTNYSNYGKDLDVVVPGGQYLGISTIDPIGSCGKSNNDYRQYNESNNGKSVAFAGTSASAPILSGALALLLESNPLLTSLQVQNLLKISSDKIGQNTPYIDDMIVSSSQSPTISGILGTNNYSNFKVRLTNELNNKIYGDYPIIINGNDWNCTISDTIDEGLYKIELVDINKITTIWATIEHFEVNTKKLDLKYINKRKNDFYGYGKLNLDELINKASNNY